MLDEGKTDVFLLLLEDVKSPEKFKRVAARALRAGKPIIVGKIGQSEAGSRAVASHTAALAGSQTAYRAMFDRYGLIEARELDDMIDLAVGFLACGDRLPAGNRVGICTSSGGAGVWMADACAWRGCRFRYSTTPRASQLTPTFPPTAPHRTQSIPQRKACTKWATPRLRGWSRNLHSSMASWWR
jgi:Acyl-CoA synthetase (NDP forming)